MGIILFNHWLLVITIQLQHPVCFRPLMGIILFNLILKADIMVKFAALVFPSPNGDYFI